MSFSLRLSLALCLSVMLCLPVCVCMSLSFSLCLWLSVSLSLSQTRAGPVSTEVLWSVMSAARSTAAWADTSLSWSIWGTVAGPPPCCRYGGEDGNVQGAAFHDDDKLITFSVLSSGKRTDVHSVHSPLCSICFPWSLWLSYLWFHYRWPGLK